ncbi:carbohydrate kinase family protein [soil metagenome]
MIVVTGSLAYDYIMEFPGSFGDHILPEQTHNVNLSFIVDKFAKRRGGTAGNTSYTLGLLKTPHILFSYVGNDFNDYKKDFKRLNIDTSYIHVIKDEHTSTGFAMTDRSQNQIWGYYYGAGIHNLNLKLATIKDPIDLVLIGPQGAEGSMSFIKECIELKIRYMFDPGFILTQVNDKDLTLGIAHADIIIGNDYEINLIKSRVKDFQKLTKEKIVITTLGEKGALIEDKGQILSINPVKIDTVVSTTGAGDAWRGGFLAGLTRNFDLHTCGQMGAVAGSFAVTKFGTQEHKYSVKEFERVYRQTYKSLLKL